MSVHISNDEEAKAYLRSVYRDEALEITSDKYQDKWLEVFQEGESLWPYLFDRFPPTDNSGSGVLSSLMSYVIRPSETAEPELIDTRLAAVHDCVNIYARSVEAMPPPSEIPDRAVGQTSMTGPTGQRGCYLGTGSTGPTGMTGTPSYLSENRPKLEYSAFPFKVQGNKMNCYDMIDLAIRHSSVKIFKDLCIRFPETIKKAVFLLRTNYARFSPHDKRVEILRHLIVEYPSYVSIVDILTCACLRDFTLLDQYLEKNPDTDKKLNRSEYVINQRIADMSSLIELDKRGFYIDITEENFGYDQIRYYFDLSGHPSDKNSFLGIPNNYFKFFELVKPKAISGGYCSCCEEENSSDTETLDVNSEEDYLFLKDLTAEEISQMMIFFKSLVTEELFNSIYDHSSVNPQVESYQNIPQLTILSVRYNAKKNNIEGTDYLRSILSQGDYFRYCIQYGLPMNEFTYDDVAHIPGITNLLKRLVLRGLKITIPPTIADISDYMFYREHCPEFLDNLDIYLVNGNIVQIIERNAGNSMLKELILDMKEKGKVLPDSIFTQNNVQCFSIYIALAHLGMSLPANYIVACPTDCLIALRYNSEPFTSLELWRSLNIDQRSAARNQLQRYEQICAGF